jgi:hypothetical protein
MDSIGSKYGPVVALVRQRTFHKRKGIPSIDERLSASGEGLFFI